MKEIRYICCQPAIPFYVWQVEVMINNFLKMEVNPTSMDIVCAIENDIIPEDWRKLQNHYNSVRFFFYNDNRLDKSYSPSVYFNMMKQHISCQPDILDNTLFLHDCDIIFTKPPNFDYMIAGDAWYLSNTNSYINYDYIQQKGNHIYEAMCKIIGIDKLIPKLMNSNSGGAQYIVKNTNFEFWEKVESDSIKLYKYFCDTEHLYILKHENDYPIQKWTAGMWSLLWNGWLFGNETIVDSRMDFAWVTDQYKNIETYGILHNAGVVNSESGMFYKGSYMNKLPYNEVLEISTHKASYYYWQEVCETAKKSILTEDRPPLIQTIPIKNTDSIHILAQKIAEHQRKLIANNTEYIPISAKCITYGRVEYIEEAIESFLRQDYKGESELVIVNDYPLQKLVFNHPKVRIYNLDKTFDTIGEKENYAVSLCKYDTIAVWDDDDICLPNHLSNINKYFKGYDLLHWNNGITLQYKKDIHIGSIGYAGYVYSKNIWDKVGGHSLENAGYDATFMKKIYETGTNTTRAHPADDEASFIYMWGNGSYHMSGLGADTDDRENVIVRHTKYIEQLRVNGNIPVGNIELHPHWNMDYVEMVKNYINHN